MARMKGSGIICSNEKDKPDEGYLPYRSLCVHRHHHLHVSLRSICFERKGWAPLTEHSGQHLDLSCKIGFETSSLIVSTISCHLSGRLRKAFAVYGWKPGSGSMLSWLQRA